MMIAMILVFVVLLLINLLLQDKLKTQQAEIERLSNENAELKAQEIKQKAQIKNLTATIQQINEIPEMERLVMSVIEVESRGNQNAKNADCNGLMQIKKGTFEPVKNVIDGSKILAHYIAKSTNNAAHDTSAEQILHRALTAYNRGWRGANKYKAKTGTFTSEYSKKVLKKYYKMKGE